MAPVPRGQKHAAPSGSGSGSPVLPLRMTFFRLPRRVDILIVRYLVSTLGFQLLKRQFFFILDLKQPFIDLGRKKDRK